MDKFSILIVDDDIAIVDVISETMDWEQLGFGNVSCAYNCSTAKEIIKNKEIDLIISDIEMPKGSGLELLQWYRENGYKGEFILLTCHERFDYATSALKFHASEYLLKPFEVKTMEAAIKKATNTLDERRQRNSEEKSEKRSELQLRKDTLVFLRDVFSGHLSTNISDIEFEIKKRKLDLDITKKPFPIVTKVTGLEKDREKMNQSLMFFVVENLHSEILCGNPDNKYVSGFDSNDAFYLVTLCDTATLDTVEEKLVLLKNEFKKIFTADMTICVGEPVEYSELYDAYKRCKTLVDANVVDFGNYFFEKNEKKIEATKKPILDLASFDQNLADRKKLEILSDIKSALGDRARQKTLNSDIHLQLSQEIMQGVYTYLGKRGINAATIMNDATLLEMTKKATQSQINMIKWVNYLLEKMYELEEESIKQSSFGEKINKYIHEHYMEDINRNTIAKEFFLAPEYLSKNYKKQTGKSLVDYISEYRVQQAKILLDKGERVSDVAEAVGFDNFTYFSTIFKKYVGVTPNSYRKK